jgi:hypothetical protein
MQGIYVIALIILLIVIYLVMPEMTISTGSSASEEGFADITIPKPVALPSVKEIAPSKSSALPSAPFYGVSEDRPCPPIDPANEATKAVRMRRLQERLDSFFLSDYKALEDKVEFLEPLTNAKALLARLREEIHLLDANPGMSPTLTEKKILEGEATISFLERKARLLTINEIEAYTDFSEMQKGSLTNSIVEHFAGQMVNTRTRASVSDLVNFNLRAWAEIQRLGSSGTTDPIINARINAIKKIRQSMQRIIDDVKQKTITEADIPVFKEDLERAFPVLADTTQEIPKLLEAFGLPEELNNIVPPGTNLTEKEINKLIAYYINHILQSTSLSMKFKLDYISPNEVRVEEAKARAENKSFEPLKPGAKMNLTFSDPVTNTIKDEVHVDAFDPSIKKQGMAKYDPGLDWKARTKQICEQVRMRGLDPQDFGCLKASDEVSPNYSWRGHAKMVCSRLGSTPDPALPTTCGCPPEGWSGWKSDFEFQN